VPVVDEEGELVSKRFATPVAVTVLVATGLAAFVGSATARGLERPRNTNTPVIQGLPQEGQTLTATEGGWHCQPGPCTFGFQWQRCSAHGVDCGAISGATNKTYVPGPQDVGSRLQVGVTATNLDCNLTGTQCAPSSGSAVSNLTAIITIKPGVAPASTAPPTISGTPQQGETLTATLGAFSGEQPLRMGIEWVRCDRAGDGCATIRGANTQSYVVGSADVGNTLRVYATATNRGGSASGVSAPTPVIRPIGPTAERRAIPVAEVVAPYRLVIDRVQVAPRPVRARSPFTVRVHINETRGFWVSGALVSVMAVPPGQVARATERRTAGDGWATFVLRPTAALGRGSLYLYVQARRPGDTAVSEASAARLIKVPVRARR
jgi:hypothetical protein